MKKLYNSRWLLTLVGLLVPVANHVLGWDLDGEQIVATLGLLAAFVVGESYRKAKVQPVPVPVGDPDAAGLPTIIAAWGQIDAEVLAARRDGVITPEEEAAYLKFTDDLNKKLLGD